MRNYDELNRFIDYRIKEEWKNYIQQYAIPLWRDAWLLKEYCEEIEKIRYHPDIK